MTTSDDVIFKVHWGRDWSAFMVLGSGIVTALAMAMAWAAWPDQIVVSVFSGVFVLLMGYAFVGSLRRLISPTLMFEVTPRGVVTYLRDTSYGGEGFLVPWQRIESLELVKRRAVGGSRSGYVWTAAARVRIDEEWSAPPEISAGGTDRDGIVHFDAITGTVRGQALVDRIERARRRFGGRGPQQAC